MNRHGNRESLTALLNKLRAKVPDIILRSTFITGFPGETDEQFEELAEFAAEIKFQRLGCFAYSAEEGTPAASFPDQIDDEIKQHIRPRQTIHRIRCGNYAFGCPKL